MKHTAVIGAGMAGIAVARTLMQAGHQVSVFEKSHGAGGRMATRNTPYGNFDHGRVLFERTIHNLDFGGNRLGFRWGVLGDANTQGA